MPPRRTGLIDERYFAITDLGFETPCWIWTRATVGERGYGQAWSTISKRRMVAHRAVWEERVGAWPDGLQADHLCRNRLCVNPDHIEPVTQTVNARRGMNAKLDESSLHDIALRYSEGWSVRSLARYYRVNRDTIKRHLRVGGRHGTIRASIDGIPSEGS